MKGQLAFYVTVGLDVEILQVYNNHTTDLPAPDANGGAVRYDAVALEEVYHLSQAAAGAEEFGIFCRNSKRTHAKFSRKPLGSNRLHFSPELARPSTGGPHSSQMCR